MTDTRTKSAGGVRTLQDLKDRCRVDTETGCWLWSMATMTSGSSIVPVVHLPRDGGDRSKHTTTPAAREAWKLAGKPLERGQVVWRHVCSVGLCINPAHCRAGTRTEMLAGVAATGRNRGKPERAACNTRARMRMVKPIDVVRQAEAMFAAGKLQKEVRAELGLSQKTAAAIRLHRHPHSAGRQLLVRGASVFTLGGRAT